ncbi:MAG TPA: DUF362 domain-containing protein [Nitrospiraceae bacterium]|nr:DUF362 domain-containing protein [Nitrospiraceae bacterium]
MLDSSRREFFARLAFGVSLFPLLLDAPRSLWSQLLFDPDGSVVAAKPIPPNPFTKNDKILVVLVHGKEPRAMLEAGLKLLGGIERLHVKDKSVLIKPNVLNDRPPPSTTNARVVEAVIDVVKGSGARHVTVADGSGIIRLPTADNLVATGVQAAAHRAGADVLALEEQPWVLVEPAQAKAMRRYFVSRPVYEAEVLINVPVIKTHRFAEYSCSLKNIVGAVHPRYRPSVTFLSGNWHERIAELNLAVHPQLTIADGTTVMIAGGPTSGTAAAAELLLLSGDRVALDMIAVGLLRAYGAWPKLQGKHITAQRQIKRAAELGLGVMDAQRIELVSQSIEGSAPAFEQLVDRIRKDVFEKTRDV